MHVSIMVAFEVGLGLTNGQMEAIHILLDAKILTILHSTLGQMSHRTL